MDHSMYVNSGDYPTLRQFATTYWYRAGKLVAKQVKTGEIEIFDPEVDLSACTKEIVDDKAAFSVARQAYSAETARCIELFRRDLFEELGITGHPKADKLYSIAWDLGHSAGLTEVESYAWQLVDLIKD